MKTSKLRGKYTQAHIYAQSHKLREVAAKYDISLATASYVRSCKTRKAYDDKLRTVKRNFKANHMTPLDFPLPDETWKDGKDFHEGFPDRTNTNTNEYVNNVMEEKRVPVWTRLLGLVRR